MAQWPNDTKKNITNSKVNKSIGTNNVLNKIMKEGVNQRLSGSTTEIDYKITPLHAAIENKNIPGLTIFPSYSAEVPSNTHS